MKRLVSILAVAPLALALLGQPSTAAPVDERVAPRQVLDVSDLPTGEPPAIAYAELTGRNRWKIHRPSGQTTFRGKLLELAPMGSGFVVQTSTRTAYETRWIGADGASGARTWRTGPGLAVSPKGGAVAFAGARGRVTVIDSDADRVLRMPRVPGRGLNSAVVVSGEDCKESATSNGCAVWVNSHRRSRSWVTSSHGLVDRTRFRQVSTGRGRWLGGITEASDTGTCSAMVRGQRTRWTTCRNRFSDISTVNEHVLGLPAYGDGFGPTTLDVLDLRSGDRVRSWVADRKGRSATYFGEIWEDPEHVLVVTFQDDKWAIVRLGLDGSMEYAVVPRTAADEFSMPLLLAAG
ncbi:hypothetical protein [Nocardioides piscis]|uniref:WD40 repeat domain-containing protein n=1 Tax=Nocardioides piscis TaxID=2714938 RepID=A0A6G7YFC0_9ACTN|nr:hypothetical protein [Nocardioides piscis]QIK75470.1 hypothetical protein G7071_08485 [Nocardioides piscis]